MRNHIVLQHQNAKFYLMLVKLNTLAVVKSKYTRNYASYKRNIALKRKFTVPKRCRRIMLGTNDRIISSRVNLKRGDKIF